MHIGVLCDAMVAPLEFILSGPICVDCKLNRRHSLVVTWGLGEGDGDDRLAPELMNLQWSSELPFLV